MSPRIIFLVVAAGCLLMMQAQDLSRKWSKIGEQNLLIGLESENEGLRTSAAQFLGDIKSEKSVIPIIHMLNSEKDETNRILAAISLYKIGDLREIRAIKDAITRDESELVQRTCQILVSSYYYITPVN